jgi:3-oxoacyl-[acyl-carrier-protein] synthase II
MGPIETPSAECATGNVAIYEGCLDIMSPLKDSPKIMVVGGTEGLTDQRDVFTVFNTIKALHTGTDPKKASRPFHKERSGFVMGAGAGALILEDLDHALARGAPIYAEVAGFSNASDGNPKGDTLPSLEGIVNAMTIARERAGPIPKKGLIYVNAHGTSTPAGDRVELQALKEVYGDVLDRLRVSSTKGNTGHLLGAAAAVEAIFTIQALNSGKLPRTRGLDDPMESNGVFLIRKRLITGEVVWGINDAFGFGGIDSVVIFKKYKPELN